MIHLGPGAGAHGGEWCSPAAIPICCAIAPRSTGAFLRTRARKNEPLTSDAVPSEGAVRVLGARAHNLKGVDAEFPDRAVQRGDRRERLGQIDPGSGCTPCERAPGARRAGRLPRPCDALLGIDYFDEVVLVDQSPIGRSSRSNPATYLKAMDELRQRFAKTEAAEHLVWPRGPSRSTWPAAAAKAVSVRARSRSRCTFWPT